MSLEVTLPDYVREALPDHVLDLAPEMARYEYEEKYLSTEFEQRECQSCHETVRHQVETDIYRDFTRGQCGACGATRELEADGGRPSQSFYVDGKAISYGPGREQDPGAWMLGLTTENSGRVEILLSEAAMYELWIEVQDVPWTRDGTARGGLQRKLVELAQRTDEETLRDALQVLSWEEGE